MFVVLVSGTLLISGVLQTFFAYQENQAALVAIQREKAIAAAGRIQAFLEGVEHKSATRCRLRCWLLVRLLPSSGATNCCD